MSPADKPLGWLHEAVKTPPFSASARVETGILLRRLQRGYRLDGDAVVIVEVFAKKTQSTPRRVIVTSRQRLRQYDAVDFPGMTMQKRKQHRLQTQGWRVGTTRGVPGAFVRGGRTGRVAAEAQLGAANEADTAPCLADRAGRAAAAQASHVWRRWKQQTRPFRWTCSCVGCWLWGRHPATLPGPSRPELHPPLPDRPPWARAKSPSRQEMMSRRRRWCRARVRREKRGRPATRGAR